MTYEAVVLAADGAGTAGVAAADTDGGDGRARQADKTANILDGDPDGAEDGRDSGGVGLKRGSAIGNAHRSNNLRFGRTGSTG